MTGQQFVLIEASYTLTRILRSLSEIECAGREAWIENPMLTGVVNSVMCSDKSEC